ncbi:MAG: hypothetical protein ACO1N3_03190 [Gammaproteobacteria bacterium]
MAAEHFELVNGATPPPVNQITLETWDEHAPKFLEDLQFFTNETATNLIKGKLDEFRLKLANPSSEEPADFAKLRQDCGAIIAEHVPDRHTPRWQNTLSVFFKVLAVALLLALAVGLTIMLQSKVAAIIGLITIASFNFKALATTSLTIGSFGGGVAALSMFMPKFHANRGLDTFSKAVNPEVIETSAVATRV